MVCHDEMCRGEMGRGEMVVMGNGGRTESQPGSFWWRKATGREWLIQGLRVGTAVGNEELLGAWGGFGFQSRLCVYWL